MLVNQLYTTLCNSMVCSPPSLSVHGILQSTTAIPFSRASLLPRDWTQVSCIASRFFTIWAIRKIHQQTTIPGGSAGNESTWNAVDMSLIPRLGRSPGKGNGYPLQYFGLGKSTDYSMGFQRSNFHLKHLWKDVYTRILFM